VHLLWAYSERKMKYQEKLIELLKEWWRWKRKLKKRKRRK